MAENILVVNFDVESEAYQALSELRHTSVTPGYVVSQACIIKKEGGHVLLQDEFDTGIETTDDTRQGGVIGSLVGILGGPLGILVGGSMGALIGNAVDTADTAKNASLIEKVCEAIPDNETSLIALTSELEPIALDAAFAKFSAHLTRFDAAEVAEEVEKAEELQRQLEKEARQKLREEKRENHMQKVAERRAKMQADFEAFKAKFTKKNN
ncbi:MAG: DUF1269 domain-containing protein [Bacteroidales bacterium]|nr:DUF1269 domain-containing protein [Bacteroidales bacterium]